MDLVARRSSLAPSLCRQHLHNRLGVRLTGFAEPGEAKVAQFSR